MFTVISMTQLQLRVSEQTIKDIDKWVKQGRFKSRSDAVKTILTIYEEKMRTMEFLKMLMKRSKEAEENPNALIALDDMNV